MMPIALLSVTELLLNLDTVYVLTGIVLFVFAVMTLRDEVNPHCVASSLFWFLLAVAFTFGSVIPHWATGLLVLAMVAIDGVGRVTRGEYNETTKAQHEAQASRLKNRIFLPILAIPFVTFAFAIAFRVALAFQVPGVDANEVNRAALVGLGVGGVVAMLLALRITGDKVKVMFNEGRRINDAM